MKTHKNKKQTVEWYRVFFAWIIAGFTRARVKFEVGLIQITVNIKLTLYRISMHGMQFWYIVVLSFVCQFKHVQATASLFSVSLASSLLSQTQRRSMGYRRTGRTRTAILLHPKVVRCMMPLITFIFCRYHPYFYRYHPIFAVITSTLPPILIAPPPSLYATALTNFFCTVLLLLSELILLHYLLTSRCT